MDLGPVEYVAVEFQGDRFNGEILAELAELVEKKVIRVLDIMFIRKTAAGDVQWLEYDGLADADKATMGFIDAGLVGLLNEDDALGVGEGLAPATAAGLLVVEDLWAKDLAAAIQRAGGRLIESDRIPAAQVEAAVAYLEQA